MIEHRIFHVEGHPRTETIRQAIDIAKGSNCVVELHWFIPYSGRYRVDVEPTDTVESVDDRLPKIYPV